MNQIAIMESKIEVLCKQVDDLSRELKIVNLTNAVEKEIMTDNFTRCKQAAEYWKEKYQEVCKCKDSV